MIYESISISFAHKNAHLIQNILQMEKNLKVFDDKFSRAVIMLLFFCKQAEDAIDHVQSEGHSCTVACCWLEQMITLQLTPLTPTDKSTKSTYYSR